MPSLIPTKFGAASHPVVGLIISTFDMPLPVPAKNPCDVPSPMLDDSLSAILTSSPNVSPTLVPYPRVSLTLSPTVCDRESRMRRVGQRRQEPCQSVQPREQPVSVFSESPADLLPRLVFVDEQEGAERTAIRRTDGSTDLADALRSHVTELATYIVPSVTPDDATFVRGSAGRCWS
jgi:hypothetical protein